MNSCQFPNQCSFPNCFCSGLQRKGVSPWVKATLNQDHQKTAAKKGEAVHAKIRSVGVGNSQQPRTLLKGVFFISIKGGGISESV